MTKKSMIAKAALSLMLVCSTAMTWAQERPGDDYENICSTTYNTTYTYRYMGTASCWAYDSATYNWQYLYQFVPLTYNSTTWITQFTGTSWLSCLAQVPYYDTITTTTPVTTCTSQPKQPFLPMYSESGFCNDDPTYVFGELYWSPQAGDTHEVQWRYLDETQFQPLWSGIGSSRWFEYLKTRRVEYRMRTTRGAATGSWAYNTPRCRRETIER